jgi:putative transferase (TIGR04331 family)
MNQSRIYIATYNATTFLETFTLNFPTIVFWNPVHWELNQKADGLFLKLEECGVFHKSPDSAALKLIEIWDNVDDWWESEKVQLALSLFITEFCKKPENFQKSFLDIFKV